MGAVEKYLQYLKEKKACIENELSEMGVDIGSIISEVPQTFFELGDRKSLKELRVACIMDTFSYDSYKEECNLMQITPDNWKEEMNRFKPDMLFVESAWQGKDNLWHKKIANISKEYFAVTSYCQDKGIPVVFWNKEDPVWTDTFMPAAKCADIVFTTDIDCIPKYKEYLNNDKVYLLHFAAQPKIHNPIEKYERKDKFCFAGAYYHRYPKRAKVFDEFSKVFIDLKGFDIYDRNYQNSRPEHAFPEIYNPYILGRLEPKEIDVAYKGYYYGINMNSVQQSQTMCARRVFEMLASNTVTIGNFSRGVKNIFGDLTICTDDVKTLTQELSVLGEEENTYRKYRLLGLRKVLSEHLYEDRLAYVVRKVFNVDLKNELPEINLIARLDGKSPDKIINSFHKLKYKNKKLYIIDDNLKDYEHSENIVVIDEQQANTLLVNEIIKDGYVGNFSTNNYYGENYLTDLALSRKYVKAKAYGKFGYYTYDQENYQLHNKENIYGFVDELLTDRGIFGKEIESIQHLTLGAFASLTSIKEKEMFSTDEYQFCEGYAEDFCAMVDDLYIADQGIGMHELEERAENIRTSLIESNGRNLSHDEMLLWAGNTWKNGLTCERMNNGLSITSVMGTEEKRYVYFNQIFDISEYAKNGKLNVFFGGMGDLDFLGVCILLDADKNKISPYFSKGNIVNSIEIPDEARFFRIGIRLSGTGNYTLQQINLGLKRNPKELMCYLNKGKNLVLTNVYPSGNNLYRNMFVHKRVRSYKEQGLVCDLMEFNTRSGEQYREFEGVNIVSGEEDMLFNVLSKSTIETVCVHFLDERMWKVLKLFKDRIRIILWFHGAESQPWWRKKCNFITKEDEENEKIASKRREAMWKEIFENRANYNIHFVFVSQAFANEVCEDYALELRKEEYSIIHNYIDTDFFKYKPKSIEQRKKILSIRPYATRRYANDLTVKCILELAKKPFFKELEFSIYGDGTLFDETVKPIEKYRNVSIHKQFLRHDEIVELHREYGVFLVPTRIDTQGVSRDEAMASGLVVITNGIPAVLEFTDKECAMVVDPDDYKAMAEMVERLYKNPDTFLEYSANARKRVESQTAKPYTINKEIELIYGDVR